MMFMLLAASITPIVISQMKQSASSVASMQAYYAAESGLQEGLYVLTHMKDMSLSELSGYVADPSNDVLIGNINLSNCDGQNGSEGEVCEEITADWRIFQSSNVGYNGSNEFSYPIPGTGTAGTVCDPFNPVVGDSGDLSTECESLKPGDGKEWAKLKCSLIMDGGLGSILKKEQGDGVDENTGIKNLLSAYSDPRDLPCNWNKIKYGETAQIPLYDKDGALDFTLPGSSFKLRVRTPCKAVCDKNGGGNCEIPELCSDEKVTGVSEGRYVLESEFEPNSNGSLMSKSLINDILVLWSIEDAECNGIFCFLDNMTSVVNIWDTVDKVQKPSLITANRVKTQMQIVTNPKYLILKGDDSTLDTGHSRGLKNADPNVPKYILFGDSDDFLSDSLSDSSYFKLHYAKQGTYQDGIESKNIPYLEYQLLYNAGGESLTSSDPLVISEGYAGGFKQTLQARYNPKTGAVNYVVQQ